MFEKQKTSNGSRPKETQGTSNDSSTISINDLSQLIDGKAKKCLCEHIIRTLKKEGIKPNKTDENTEISCHRADIIIKMIDELNLSSQIEAILEKEIDFGIADKEYKQIFGNFIKEPSNDTLKVATKQLVTFLEIVDKLRSNHGITDQNIKKIVNSIEKDFDEKCEELTKVDEVLTNYLKDFSSDNKNFLIDNCKNNQGNIPLLKLEKISKFTLFLGVKQDAKQDAVEKLLSYKLDDITVTLGNPQLEKKLSSKILAEFFVNKLPMSKIPCEITDSDINTALNKLKEDFNIRLRDNNGNKTKNFEVFQCLGGNVFTILQNVSKEEFNKLCVEATNEHISSISNLEGLIAKVSSNQDGRLCEADRHLVPDMLKDLYNNVDEIYRRIKQPSPSIEITGMTGWVKSFNEHIKKFSPTNDSDLLSAHLKGFVYESQRTISLFDECKIYGDTIVSFDIGRKYHCVINNKKSKYYNQIVNGEFDIIYTTKRGDEQMARERFIEVKASLNAAEESLNKGQMEKLMCIFMRNFKGHIDELDGHFEVLGVDSMRMLDAFDDFISKNGELIALFKEIFNTNNPEKIIAASIRNQL